MALKYQGRSLPSADCSNGQSCGSVTATTQDNGSGVYAAASTGQHSAGTIKPVHPLPPGLLLVPPIALVRVAAESFAAGDRLSPALQRALPRVVEVVAGVATGRHRVPYQG